MSDKDIKYLLYSVAFHLTLALVLTVKIFVFPNVRIDTQRAVRVDFVALPDKDPVEGPKGVTKELKGEEKQAPPPPPAEKTVNLADKKDTTKKSKDKEAPKEETKKKPDDTSAKDQQNALARLQALQKIKKMKGSKETGPEGAQYKGNQISEGSSLTGVDKLQHDKYIQDTLVDHVKPNWQLPEWLANKGLSATVLIKFDESGRVLHRVFIRKSGNETFDSYVMQAIEASSPFPPPPAELISYFKVRGIGLGFPLEN